MERDPIGNDARRAARQRKLGPDSICIRCGYAKPEGLVSVHRNVFEKHHVVGRANDPELTVVLCLRCHAEITEEYRKAGVSMAPPLSASERTIASLEALATFLPALGHSCSRLAVELEREQAARDGRSPDTRKGE